MGGFGLFSRIKNIEDYLELRFYKLAVVKILIVEYFNI
jgi:hypothetical protein